MASCRSKTHEDEIRTMLSSQSLEGISYKLVDQDAQIEPALAKLRERSVASPFLAVDCEGESLSRKGELVILSVATEHQTYLFNIKKLGTGVFDKGLRDLLEDPTREKLMFDCRQDSDCLWHQYRVKLTNVLDLQLLEIVCRGDHKKHTSVLAAGITRTREYLPRVNGFMKCLQKYSIQDVQILKAKEVGTQVMKREGVWLEQPLQKALLEYSAADVKGFFKLYQALKGGVAIDRNALRVASQNYLDFFRSRVTRTHDKFERNGFVPWRIFPTTGGSGQATTCQKCRQDFPRSDFETDQLRSGNQMCLVCKRVKIEIDKGYY